MRNKKFSAFSLIEMSFVILIIGILISGIVGGRALIYKSGIASARNLTKNSPVLSMKSGLVLWFDSVSEGSFKNITINDNDGIDAWYDINPLAKKTTFVQSNSKLRPQYRERGINNLPALYFDGTNDTMSAGAPFYDALYPKVVNDFAVFIVANATATQKMNNESKSSGGIAKQNYLFFPPHGSASYPNIPNAVGSGIAFATNGISVYEHAANYMPTLLSYSPAAVAGSSSVATPVVMLLEYNNKTPSLYINKKLVRTGLQSTKDFIFFSHIIGGVSGYGFFQGYLGEFIIFNRTLNSEEKDNVADYLKAKWRIN